MHIPQLAPLDDGLDGRGEAILLVAVYTSKTLTDYRGWVLHESLDILLKGSMPAIHRGP